MVEKKRAAEEPSEHTAALHSPVSKEGGVQDVPDEELPLPPPPLEEPEATNGNDLFNEAPDVIDVDDERHAELAEAGALDEEEDQDEPVISSRQ
jgi:hypothetical protein